MSSSQVVNNSLDTTSLHDNDEVGGGNLSSNTGSSSTDHDESGDECAICNDGGELICCDSKTCNKAYHAKCIKVDLDTLPVIWYCPSCSCSTPSNSLPMAKQIIHPVNNNNDSDNAEKGDNEAATMKPTNQQSNATPDNTPTTCNEYPSSTSSTTKNIPTHNTNNNNQAVIAAAASNNRNKINQELSFTGDKNGAVVQNSQSQQQSEIDLVNNSSKAPPQPQQQQQQQQPTEKTLNAPHKKGGLTYKESASGRLRPTCRIPECNNFSQKGGFCERHISNTSKENTAAKKKVRVKSSSSFRTVTVPDGVVSGDMFHVLLGKGKVMGVICPTGVFSGDKLIVINPGVQRPPIAAKKIAKMNEQYFTQGIEASLEPSYVASTFWRAVWPALSLAGWTYKRQVHYNFGATLVSLPEAQYADRSNQLLGVHYFDNIRDIRNYMLGNSEYESIARAFNADIAKKTKEVEQQAELKKKKRVTNNDAWKNVGEREHISIGSCYQVRSLPKAGSHVDGEGHACSLNYVSESKQEQIWNTEEDAATTPILTPSTWYDTAKEPGFLDQFHKAIMKSKKQMRDLAKAINKTVGFCLWYYYTSYKPNKEMYGELKKLIKELKSHDNADECTICDEGGDLLCCETCPNSYHINCLGIEPSEIEGKWSCPVCVRKRKLQLSPPKSPRKRHKNDSPDGNPSSPAFEEVIAKIARENQIPQL